MSNFLKMNRSKMTPSDLAQNVHFIWGSHTSKKLWITSQKSKTNKNVFETLSSTLHFKRAFLELHQFKNNNKTLGVIIWHFPYFGAVWNVQVNSCFNFVSTYYAMMIRMDAIATNWKSSLRIEGVLFYFKTFVTLQN